MFSRQTRLLVSVVAGLSIIVIGYQLGLILEELVGAKHVLGYTCCTQFGVNAVQHGVKKASLGLVIAALMVWVLPHSVLSVTAGCAVLSLPLSFIKKGG